eukprot:13052665-Alexandrium_andersonii.AAC.1
MSKRHGRWITARELLASLGMPVTPELQRATGGAVCQFSAAYDGGSLFRTPRTIRMHAGNSMHLNAVGAIHLAILLTFSTFDAAASSEPSGTTTPSTPASSSGSSLKRKVDAPPSGPSKFSKACRSLQRNKSK